MQTDRKDVPTKRIFFLNRFFPPDQSATSRLVGDLATDLVARGHEVHVITSQQLYDQPQARLPAQEFLGGVEVHRVPPPDLAVPHCRAAPSIICCFTDRPVAHCLQLRNEATSSWPWPIRR